MRRTEFMMSPGEAEALLTALPTIHLASTLADGAPILRTLHHVIEPGWIAFHAAPKGEKTGLVGRVAVVQAEEVVATVPSTFFDPVKACPATTYYRSVQVHGVVEELVDPPVKARVLQALMEKLQPEGGYAPITADDRRYRGPVNGLLVAGIRLDHVTGKAKLAQNRTPAQVVTLLEQLWKRGLPEDPRAVELVRAANPLAATPAFLAGPAGTILHAWLPTTAAGDAAALIVASGGAEAGERDRLVRAHQRASVWVGARDANGRLIASARALADGGPRAWLHELVVAAAWRGRGLDTALLRLVTDHPAVRAATVSAPLARADDPSRPWHQDDRAQGRVGSE